MVVAATMTLFAIGAVMWFISTWLSARMDRRIAEITSQQGGNDRD